MALQQQRIWQRLHLCIITGVVDRLVGAVGIGNVVCIEINTPGFVDLVGEISICVQILSYKTLGAVDGVVCCRICRYVKNCRRNIVGKRIGVIAAAHTSAYAGFGGNIIVGS